MVSISLKTKKSFIAHPWCLLSVAGLEEYSAHDWWAGTSVQRAPVTWREWGLWSRPTWSELLRVAWRFWLTVDQVTPYQSLSYARHIAVIPAAKLCDSIAIVFLSIEVRIWHHLCRATSIGSAILFKGLIMDMCVLLTSTPEWVSPRDRPARRDNPLGSWCQQHTQSCYNYCQDTRITR